MRARFTVITAGIVLAVGVLTTGSTATADDRKAVAVVVGQTGTPAGCGPGNTTWVQYATAAAPTYSVPGPGVITSVSHNANATAGSIRAVVLGPAAAPNNRTVLGYSAPLAVTPSTLNTFSVRIPAPAGAGLGLHISAASMGCLFNTAAPGDVLAGGFLDPSARASSPPRPRPQRPAQHLRGLGAGRRRRPVRRRLPGPLPPVGADAGGLSRTGHGHHQGARQEEARSARRRSSSPRCRVRRSPVRWTARPPSRAPRRSRSATSTASTSSWSPPISNVGILDPTPAKVKFKVLEPADPPSTSAALARRTHCARCDHR